jgi:hypothetical protein
LFVKLFSKKKTKMPSGNSRQLVEAFDTLEDPTLALERSSVRRGAEAIVALAMSHGENVDWEKVSSSHARGPLEMKEFFTEAKKHSPNLVSLILHALLFSTDAPSSSAPPAPDFASLEVAKISARSSRCFCKLCIGPFVVA